MRERDFVCVNVFVRTITVRTCDFFSSFRTQLARNGVNPKSCRFCKDNIAVAQMRPHKKELFVTCLDLWLFCYRLFIHLRSSMPVFLSEQHLGGKQVEQPCSVSDRSLSSERSASLVSDGAGTPAASQDSLFQKPHTLGLLVSELHFILQLTTMAITMQYTEEILPSHNTSSTPPFFFITK